MRREPFVPYEGRDERQLEIDGATVVADLFLPALARAGAILIPGTRPRQQSRIQAMRSLRRSRFA